MGEWVNGRMGEWENGRMGTDLKYCCKEKEEKKSDAEREIIREDT